MSMAAAQSSSSVSRGLQALAALQAMPHETMARHATRLEILLGELAGNQPEVLDELQVDEQSVEIEFSARQHLLLLFIPTVYLVCCPHPGLCAAG